MYDKLGLAISQGLRAAPHGIEPPADLYPVISRPIMNLAGLGCGARIYRSAADFSEWSPGHFWSEIVTGEHRSTDVVLLAGSVIWDCVSVGIPGHGFTFKEWDVGVSRGREWTAIFQWLGGRFHAYSGVMNIETIGDKIIEGHLRPSEQFLDLYPPSFMGAIERIYAGHRDIPPMPRAQGGVSLPLWFEHDRRRPDDDAVGAGCRSSVHIRVAPGEDFSDYLNPPGGYLVGYVNNANSTEAASDYEAVRDHIMGWPER